MLQRRLRTMIGMLPTCTLSSLIGIGSPEASKGASSRWMVKSRKTGLM